MLDSKEFDLWADGYDRSVNLSENANEYPFAGYKQVLGFLVFDTLQKAFPAAVFHKLSHCAGVVSITPCAG